MKRQTNTYHYLASLQSPPAAQSSPRAARTCCCFHVVPSVVDSVGGVQSHTAQEKERPEIIDWAFETDHPLALARDRVGTAAAARIWQCSTESGPACWPACGQCGRCDRSWLARVHEWRGLAVDA
jgi:hypothetical protein